LVIIFLIGAKLVTMGKISKYGSLSFFKRETGSEEDLF
jgi:hypothetical protein